MLDVDYETKLSVKGYNHIPGPGAVPSLDPQWEALGGSSFKFTIGI